MRKNLADTIDSGPNSKVVIMVFITSIQFNVRNLYFLPNV